MTKKFILSFCLFASYSFGQSFSSSNEIATGTSQTLYLCDSATTDYASIKGDGVIWDYSNVKRFDTPSSIARTFKYQSNLKPSVYTNALQTKTSEEPLSFYLSSNSNERFIEGFEYQDASFGLVSANFTSDNMKIMTYPFGFNSEVNDNFNGILKAGTMVNTSCTGSSKSIIDGRGKILLGNGVEIDNVVRHNLDFSLTASTFLGVVNVKVKQYEYYDLSNSNLPVFTHTNLDITQGSASLIKMNFVFNSVEPIKVTGLLENGLNQLSIYPNPVKDFLKIADNSVVNVKVTDVSGNVLKTSTNSSVSVSDLVSGIYFVVFDKGGISYSLKFIKE